jgi:DNA-binding CsgD family transcriptional regulator
VHLLPLGPSRLLLLEQRPAAPPWPPAAFPLSRRQAEILGWICRGKSNRDIADILSISVRTVEKHVEHILDHLGVGSRTAAVALVLSWMANLSTGFDLPFC